MKFLKYLFLVVLAIGGVLLLNMKEEGPNPKDITIAFYNVENLFDTINDPHSNDDKFLPSHKCRWTSKRYLNKVLNLGKVIDQLGDANGPELIGLSEIENGAVLSALINTKILKDKEYKIIHFESNDRRGIDVALLYKNGVFKPYRSMSKTIPSDEDKNFRTRDLLIVSGVIGKDSLHCLVNHWPSRIGGTKSEFNRIKVATYVREVTDSLLKISKNAKIIIMGDFNDEPSDKSISSVLRAKEEISLCKGTDLYNPFYHIMNENRGTYKYKGEWEMLDQLIISKGLVEGKKLRYKKDSEDIYNPLWMYYKENKIHGPYRTYMGSNYYGGYSDHFPVYIVLSREY